MTLDNGSNSLNHSLTRVTLQPKVQGQACGMCLRNHRNERLFADITMHNCTGAVPRALSEQINLSLHISHENFVTENEIFCSNYTMDNNRAFGPGAFDILALP